MKTWKFRKSIHNVCIQCTASSMIAMFYCCISTNIIENRKYDTLTGSGIPKINLEKFVSCHYFIITFYINYF